MFRAFISQTLFPFKAFTINSLSFIFSNRRRFAKVNLRNLPVRIQELKEANNFFLSILPLCLLSFKSGESTQESTREENPILHLLKLWTTDKEKEGGKSEGTCCHFHLNSTDQFCALAFASSLPSFSLAFASLPSSSCQHAKKHKAVGTRFVLWLNSCGG